MNFNIDTLNIDRIMNDINITDDREIFDNDKSGELYLVADLSEVRDALYDDIESGIFNIEGREEDNYGFLVRHGIEILA